MIEAKFVNPRENFLLRDVGFDKFVTHSDLVCVFIAPSQRGRVVIPAGALVKRPKPKWARAKLVRRRLKDLHLFDPPMRPRLRDLIYTELLWRDGVPRWRALLERRALYILGLLRHGPRYAKALKDAD